MRQTRTVVRRILPGRCADGRWRWRRYARITQQKVSAAEAHRELFDWRESYGRDWGGAYPLARDQAGNPVSGDMWIALYLWRRGAR